MTRLLLFLLLLGTGFSAERPNLIVILSDDHRYDFMGFMDAAPDFLETPNLDRIASAGAHLQNAFVSTSLCSPSRASILTGQYMHRHKVVDNQRAVPEGTRFYPEYLQAAGYRTAMVGKWHMGHDERRAAARGSTTGSASAGRAPTSIPSPQHQWQAHQDKGLHRRPAYRPGVWSGSRGTDRGEADAPFMLHLAFKSVHYPFQPAERHRGRYEGKVIDYPETMANSDENYATQPRWVRERRYGIHGIDHMETGAFDKDPVPSFDDLYWRFCETVHGLDENVGRVLDYLDQSGLAKNTVVIYLGDNGFALGEHGFYDKRDAFEESIRVPMLAYAPGSIPAGTTVAADGAEHRHRAHDAGLRMGVGVPEGAP